MSDLLRTLAHLRGIGEFYYDQGGELRHFTDTTRAALLRAMGFAVEDAQALQLAIREQESSRWLRLAPPVLVLNPDDAREISIAIPRNLPARHLDWTLELEDGAERHGQIDLAALVVSESANIQGLDIDEWRLPLPSELPLGYHDFTLAFASGLRSTTRLIVAPLQCYMPRPLADGTRCWGLSIQLYTLKSARNWGIGDFADLCELIELAAARGCALIGLNPLHALLSSDPAHISPYSPGSRHFLNPLYIAVPQVAEFAECESLRQCCAQSDALQKLTALRATANVRYEEVARFKFAALRELYGHFRVHHLSLNTTRAVAFRDHVAQCGEPLRLHAIHACLDEQFRKAGPQYWGWPAWPDDFKNSQSLAVQSYAREHLAEIEFHQYLQWIAQAQLADARQLAERSGMLIGLYGDVAVGANLAGSETWSNRRLYVQGVSIGAPPDPLALKGQAWGVPPQDPIELQGQHYAPFVRLLRDTMRHMNALRLDHVMSLIRLWWVPENLSATAGAYVRYPLHDLMGILALESLRNRCLVIGEDLGTVPDEMRVAMERSRVFHYKVLFFEKDGPRFKAPHEYTQCALATVTTHDLPTLRGWWQGDDLNLRDELHLYPAPHVRQQLHNEREADRVLLLNALVSAGLWRWQSSEALPEYSEALARAVQLYLGSSASLIAMLQLEDLLGMNAAVNVPGTHTEHANWQRKMTATTAQLFAREGVHELLQAMNKARTGMNPNYEG